MNTKTMAYKNINTAASKEKLMEDLRLVVADAEELLHATAHQAGEGAVSARAHIQQSLQVIKERLAASEIAVIERTRQAVKVADKYIYDNHWNWH